MSTPTSAAGFRRRVPPPAIETRLWWRIGVVIARPERVVELTVAGVAGTGEPVKKAAKKLPAD